MKTQESYHLRWRGRQIGPLTVSEIEQQLDDQEVGMLHEILHEQRWITLNDFFVQISLRAKACAEVNGTAGAASAATSRSNAAPTCAPSRSNAGARLVPHGITKTVLSSGKEITLLDDVTFVIQPNEFVALLGPSGSGKSTLMDAINGRRRATSGSVSVNGEDLYSQFERLRDNIGYVPQKDIVHLPLTVRQELTFAARLRLPAETPAEAIDRIVTDVITKIGLKERQHTRNVNLSGGQLKRVSVGVELLANPSLLFLDEPTTGLDPGTEARMMTLFGKLAAEGKTIVCITHNMENLGLCDLIALLSLGRLVYYGPPADLLTYFGVRLPKDIFDVALGNKSDDETVPKRLAAQWAERYRSSEYYDRYVAQRLQQKVPLVSNLRFSALLAPRAGFTNGLRQFLILTQRYATVTVQDKRNLFFLLAQAPVIAVLIAILFHRPEGSLLEKDQIMISYFMAISAIWFGCFSAAREIVKELPIYLRERAINLCLPSYLGSKMAVLSVLCVLQCIILFFLTTSLAGFHPEAVPFGSLLIITSLCGMMFGLLFSACLDKADWVMTILPMLLIPQFLFTNALKPLSGLAKKIGYYFVISFWSVDGMLHTLGKGFPVEYDLQLDVLSLCMLSVVFAAATLVTLKFKDRSI
jgi:ABC-type multidrug transport system ATPase subunit